MSAIAPRLAFIAFIVLLTGGCATATEWATWRAHPTHFASADHLSFSIRNTEGAEARVTRRDLAAARHEGRWGDPVTVPQDRILER